jgi:hypothetical protein
LKNLSLKAQHKNTFAPSSTQFLEPSDEANPTSCLAMDLVFELTLREHCCNHGVTEILQTIRCSSVVVSPLQFQNHNLKRD